MCSSKISVGLVADVQYADRDDIPQYDSYYRVSIPKFQECVEVFNNTPLDFAIQLGDIVDRDMASFDTVLPIWNKVKCKKYNVMGNHDLQETADYTSVMHKMSMEKAYYHFSLDGWRFIVLDTSEISIFSQPEGSEKHKLAESILQELTDINAPEALPWNGTMSEQQLKWLDEVLASADTNGEKVIVFGHYPIVAVQPTLMVWKSERIISVLESHKCFKAYICGHDHAGGYIKRDSKHYLIVDGMMASPDTNAYAIMDIYKNRISVKGFGRQKNIEMIIE